LSGQRIVVVTDPAYFLCKSETGRVCHCHERNLVPAFTVVYFAQVLADPLPTPNAGEVKVIVGRRANW